MCMRYTTAPMTTRRERWRFSWPPKKSRMISRTRAIIERLSRYFSPRKKRDSADRHGSSITRRPRSIMSSRWSISTWSACGAYLGTVPDYRAMDATTGGVLLADVRAGGPADLAGIRGGDRIIQMAGTRIENLYDMTFALQDHKPGETIDVTVVRAGDQKK